MSTATAPDQITTLETEIAELEQRQSTLSTERNELASTLEQNQAQLEQGDTKVLSAVSEQSARTTALDKAMAAINAQVSQRRSNIAQINQERERAAQWEAIKGMATRYASTQESTLQSFDKAVQQFEQAMNELFTAGESLTAQRVAFIAAVREIEPDAGVHGRDQRKVELGIQSHIGSVGNPGLVSHLITPHAVNIAENLLSDAIPHKVRAEEPGRTVYELLQKNIPAIRRARELKR